MYTRSLFLIFLFLINTCGFAQTFHGVIVAATSDPVLSVACEQDVATMKTNFEQISGALGYSLNLITVSREQFGRAGLEKALKQLECGPSDIVFFYYTGHGYNLETRNSKYPVLHLESDLSRNISLEDVHAALKQKGSRLCISLGDCCNNIYKGRPSVNRSIPGELKLSKAIINQLFIVPKGDILIASSDRSQVSGAYLSGSFYTFGFDKALNHALFYNQQVDWTKLLTDAQGCMESLDVARLKGQRSIFKTDLSDVQPNAEQATDTSNVTPVPDANSDLTPKPDYALVNQALNQLIDETIPSPQRKQIRNQLSEFFVKNARVKLYQEETEVGLQPIEITLDRLFINAEKIGRVNIIERKSKGTADGKRYQAIGLQEEWNLDDIR